MSTKDYSEQLLAGCFGVYNRGYAKNDRDIRVINFEVTDSGSRQEASAIFRISGDLGLPTEEDLPKWLAFVVLAERARRRTGAEQIPSAVRFSAEEMMEVLGAPKHGEVYEEISSWGRRLASISITLKQTTPTTSSEGIFLFFSRFRGAGCIDAENDRRDERFEAFIEDWLRDYVSDHYDIAPSFPGQDPKLP